MWRDHLPLSAAAGESWGDAALPDLSWAGRGRAADADAGAGIPCQSGRAAAPFRARSPALFAGTADADHGRLPIAEGHADPADAGGRAAPDLRQIGRAPCRERVCQYV